MGRPDALPAMHKTGKAIWAIDDTCQVLSSKHRNTAKKTSELLNISIEHADRQKWHRTDGCKGPVARPDSSDIQGDSPMIVES